MFSIGDSLEGIYLTSTAGYEIASEFNIYYPIFITFQRDNDFLAQAKCGHVKKTTGKGDQVKVKRKDVKVGLYDFVK